MRETINSIVVEWLEAAGETLGSRQSALDLIGSTYRQDIGMFVIPVARLDPGFFRLGSGLAGEFIEKLQQYEFRLAIVGDVTAYVERSKALRDFIYETNARGHHLFLGDAAELNTRLK